MLFHLTFIHKKDNMIAKIFLKKQMDSLPEIPGYSVKQRVGQGSLAQIFRGSCLQTGRPVAIKILERKYTRDYELAKRFLREAQTGADLKHPNIVEIYQTGCTDRCHFMIMEYLETTLRDRLNARKAAASPTFHPQDLHILMQMAEALDYAHQRGVIHRDIKPENIMFRADSTPVLVDFGLAKIKHSKEKLTKTDVSVGTPFYMSPEQIQGQKKIDGRSDFYSLGVVFYEMLCGEVPYKADDFITLAMKHLKKKVPKLPKKIKPFQPLLDKMMAKDPGQRLPSGEALIKIIIELQNRLPE